MVLYYLQSVCEPPVLPNLQQLPPRHLLSHPALMPILFSLPPEVVQRYHTHEHWLENGPETRYNIYFLDNPHILSFCWEQRNHQSIGGLLFGFFQFWAQEFKYRDDVASVRFGRLMTKEEKEWVPIIEKKKKDAENGDKIDPDGKGSESQEETQPSEPTPKVEKTPSIDDGEKTQSKKLGDSSVKPNIPRGPLQRYWLCIEDPFEITHNLGRPVGRDSLYFIRGEFLKAHAVLVSSKSYRRSYITHLPIPPELRPSVPPADAEPPRLLRMICEETRYKTREEHKQRNKENMEFSERRKQIREAGETTSQLSEFIKEPGPGNSRGRGGFRRGRGRN
jgi:DNA polymerase sigma